LPAEEQLRLLPHLTPVSLNFGNVLYLPRGEIDFVYFPVRAVVSGLSVMEDGTPIEVVTVGNEGMIGLPVCLGVTSAPYQFVVQVAGNAIRMRADVLQAEVGRNGALQKLLARYQAFRLAQVTQSVACNGLHTVQQRCCRWLLTTSDQVRSDEFPVTHELLAQMLGVRRATITDVLAPLQLRGLIRNGRGRIFLLNRGEMEAACCECYHRVREEYEHLFGPAEDEPFGAGVPTESAYRFAEPSRAF
jgi:CRP-like cAMP-binding protein